MFNSLKKLFGGTPPAQGDTAATLAQPEPPPPARNQISGFLCREAVFDRKSRMAGHFFHLQPTETPAGEPRRAIDETLLETLLAAETGNTGLVFVPISSASLDLSAVERLPPDNLVLLVELEEEASAEQLQPRLAALAERGLKLGIFRQQRNPLFGQLIATVDFAAIDDANIEPASIRDFSAAVRADRDRHPILLFASNINTLDEHQLYHQSHYDYFHGRFAASTPPPKGKPGSDPHKVLLLKLLRLVQGDAETAEIASAMKLDPMLAFRIMRYLNSPALGLTHPVESLNQALVILGRQRLARWLAVLIFSVREPNFADWLLVESALTRGRLMELLGAKLMPGRSSDPLFLTGLFSCIDRLLHMPMAEALADIPLADEVRSALLEGSGPYAKLLALAAASESFDTTQIAEAAQANNLDPDQLNHALLVATTWACEMTAHWD